MNKYITEDCDTCDGFKKTPKRYPNSNIHTELEDCPTCKGAGKLPNEEGKQILQLIEKFGRKRI